MSTIGKQIRDWEGENLRNLDHPDDHVLDVRLSAVEAKLGDFAAAVQWGDRQIIGEQAVEMVRAVVTVCEAVNLSFDAFWYQYARLMDGESSLDEYQAKTLEQSRIGNRL